MIQPPITPLVLNPMKPLEYDVLIGCEMSGIVRDALIARGIRAVSCDLLPSERPGPHIQGDVLEHLYYGWKMAIFHPPCTHLAVSGARWFTNKREKQNKAAEFFMKLVCAPIPRIAIENPISIMSTFYRKPDQIIQPWMFGHGETKATCWWLKGLPPLKPTQIVQGREHRIHKMPPSKDRWKERSRTYQGIADAIAEQWGGLIA